MAIENPVELVKNAAINNPRISIAAGMGALGMAALGYFASKESQQLAQKGLFLALETGIFLSISFVSLVFHNS